MIVACDYSNWAAFIVSWARRFPLLIAFFISVASYVTGEPIFACASWALTFVWLSLYPWKAYFNVLRADPFCPAIMTWAFPNDEMVYTAFVVTFVIGYTIFWKSHRSPFQWICLVLVLLGPSVILLWFDGISWLYLFLSALIGIAVAVLLIWWIWNNEDLFVFMFTIWPLSYLYSDTIMVRNTLKQKKRKIAQHYLDEHDKAVKERRRRGYTRMAFASFV
jgi:hypothetical protein